MSIVGDIDHVISMLRKRLGDDVQVVGLRQCRPCTGRGTLSIGKWPVDKTYEKCGWCGGHGLVKAVARTSAQHETD